MELGSSVAEFLEHKTILVTGAAGFLAKIFIEKIMREQPNVKKLYLLLRASDNKSALHRFNTEVMAKELFKVVKEKWGSNLNGIIHKKIIVVAGDITCNNLGIQDTSMLEKMRAEVEIVVNLAATTNFYERYDVSFGINTIGAKQVLNFAMSCTNIKLLLHVSTAYVSGEKEGLIKETLYEMGETLNGTKGLEIEAEEKLIEETLTQLRATSSSDHDIKSAMKDLGIQRTVDSIAIGYAKGKMKYFIGDHKTIVDLIPADMVVNAMIMAMIAHENNSNENSDEIIIYHIGSSSSNPNCLGVLQDCIVRYFMKNPWINKDGKLIIVGKIQFFQTMDSFKRFINIRYMLPLKGLQLLNSTLCRSLNGVCHDLHTKINFVIKMADLYGPYLFFKGIYDDKNTKLLMSARENDLFFDPQVIDWEDYLMNTHLPGVAEYIFK